MEWLTLIQEHLFPAIVKYLLRVLVVFAPEDRCERGNVLSYTTKASQSQCPPNPKFEYSTSASRMRISDLRLPFLMEPGREN